MSDYSFFPQWKGWRVQSTLLHLDGYVKKVIVALAPAEMQQTKKKKKIFGHI